MTASVTFRLNDLGMEALLQDATINAYLDAIGAVIVNRAKAIARVDTGAYRDSITYTVDHDGTRSQLIVYSTDQGAVAIEARDRTLARALGAVSE